MLSEPTCRCRFLLAQWRAMMKSGAHPLVCAAMMNVRYRNVELNRAIEAGLKIRSHSKLEMRPHLTTAPTFKSFNLILQMSLPFTQPCAVISEEIWKRRGDRNHI